LPETFVAFVDILQITKSFSIVLKLHLSLKLGNFEQNS